MTRLLSLEAAPQKRRPHHLPQELGAGVTFLGRHSPFWRRGQPYAMNNERALEEPGLDSFPAVWLWADPLASWDSEFPVL